MKMISFVFALATLVVANPSAYAQAGITGTWQVLDVPNAPWMFELKAEESKLSGSAWQGRGAGNEIYEARIEGNRIFFKVGCIRGQCNSENILTGTLSGNEILFTRDIRIPEGRQANGNALFGAGVGALREFKAQRIPPAEVQVRGVEFAAAVNLVQKDVKVAGTLFLPSKVSRVRALIVMPAWGLAGAFYEDPQLGHLLEATDSGVLSIRISRVLATRTDGQQTAATADGVDGLLTLLARLAQESGHQELAEAPLLFWGHSAAGGFGQGFAEIHPQRTIAFVRYHSGGRPPTNTTALSQIPALIVKGGKDTSTAGDSEDMWKGFRAAGGPWTFSLNPDATHGDEEFLKKANDIVLPWITAVMRLRLSPDGGVLRPVSDVSTWLGNLRTREIAPYGSYRGSKTEANWFPDEASARGWLTVLGSPK